MKAIVHIGYPKAGSSSIQSFLHHNRHALAARGLRYANYREADGSGLGSQWEYVLAALDTIDRTIRNEEPRKRYNARDLAEQRQTSAAHLARLREMPARYAEPTAVISSEHCVPWLDSPEAIAALDRMLRDTFTGGVRYVVYLREQVDQLTSAYSERIKRGATAFPYQLIARRLPALKMYRTVAMWARTLGDDRLDVRLLDPDFLVRGDLISDFCSLLGIDPDAAALERPPRENESLKAAGAEALRVMNKRLPELRPDGAYNPLRRDIVETVMALSRNDAKFRLTHRQARRIQRHVAASNEQLRRAFFPDRDTLFSTTPDTVPERDLETLRVRALDILTEIVIKFRLGELTPLDDAERPAAHVRR